MTTPEHDDGKPGTALQLVTGADDQDLQFETLQSEQTFEPGYYWTCIEACDDGDIEVDDTLLLMDIHEFEGNAHSVVLRCHPRHGEGQHTVMVVDFMRCFVPCHNADAIRQAEQQAVMKEVADLQDELMRTQLDPQLMIAAVRDDVEAAIKKAEEEDESKNPRAVEKVQERQKNIAKTHRRAARRSAAAGNPLTIPRAALASDLGDLISAGINETGVAEMSKLAGRQAIIASAQAEWLVKKTGAISKTLTKLAPYIAERSAVALARASGAVKLSKRIMRGIKSLDLYTGKDVDAFEIRAGAAASTAEPLTIIQGKRYAEEELAAWADVTEDFDFRDKDRFFKAIAESDELMQQILPTPRCVVSIAMTRHERQYNDPLANMLYNIQNALVFLLVRNGGNVHVVYSGSPSHEGAKRLFPTMDDLQRPFGGIDGSRISIRDTEFGEAAKWFDDIALVYRRFLILLCGLDHRLQLFGEFYPPEKSMSFMTTEFQADYFRFVTDDEGMLLGDNKPDLSGWMDGHNKMTQSGSRIFVLNHYPAIEDHAPEVKRRYDLRPTPEQFKRPFIAQREGTRFFVGLEASARNSSREVEQARCWLSGEKNSAHHSAWWLCVDDVSLEEVRAYRHSRVYRSMGIAYLRLFRRLESYLEAELAVEHDAREYLLKQATEFGGLTPELARAALDGAVRNYRASRRGAPLPGVEQKAELNKVLTLMVPEGHVTASVEALLATYIKTTGCTPLLLTRTGKAKLYLYVEANAADRAAYPDILTWGWVKRITLEVGKTKLKEANDTLVWLTGVLPASQVELRRWAALTPWLNDYAEPLALRTYGAIPALLDAAKEWEPILRAGPGAESGVSPELYSRVANGAYVVHEKGTSSVMEYAILAIPVAAYSRNGRELNVAYMATNAEHVLYTYGNAEQKARILAQLSRFYSSASKHRAAVMLRGPLEWHLVASNEALTIAHDAPVKNGVPGACGTPAWAMRKIRANSSGKGFFSHDKAARKKGGPQLTEKSAPLSLDRAFDELTGRSTTGLRALFRAAQKDKARSLGSWSWDRSDPEGETYEQKEVRLKKTRQALIEQPYVHAYKSLVSPLVSTRADGRTQANTLFTLPLLKTKKPI